VRDACGRHRDRRSGVGQCFDRIKILRRLNPGARQPHAYYFQGGADGIRRRIHQYARRITLRYRGVHGGYWALCHGDGDAASSTRSASIPAAGMTSAPIHCFSGLREFHCWFAPSRMHCQSAYGGRGRAALGSTLSSGRCCKIWLCAYGVESNGRSIRAVHPVARQLPAKISVAISWDDDFGPATTTLTCRLEQSDEGATRKAIKCSALLCPVLCSICAVTAKIIFPLCMVGFLNPAFSRAFIIPDSVWNDSYLPYNLPCTGNANCFPKI
jgi:hypothetical protein